jgi:hypothetical protein
LRYVLNLLRFSIHWGFLLPFTCFFLVKGHVRPVSLWCWP